jgi:trehalose/maltose transport system substrate-binding protein
MRRRTVRAIASLAMILGLALVSTAHAAEITFSCGSQELEMRLCREAAQAWSAQSAHSVRVVGAPERSNDRYFQ